MAIRKSTGIFHFTWLQQNLCCERPTRPTDIASLFLIADDRRNLRHTTDFLLQFGGLLILSAPSKSQHDRQSLFVCFSVNYFKYNVCSHSQTHFPFPHSIPTSTGSLNGDNPFLVSSIEKEFTGSLWQVGYINNSTTSGLCTSNFLSSACLGRSLSFL